MPFCLGVFKKHIGTLSFHWLQTAYFPIFVSSESHAIKHYTCVNEPPKLQLHLSTCSLSTVCVSNFTWFKLHVTTHFLDVLRQFLYDVHCIHIHVKVPLM